MIARLGQRGYHGPIPSIGEFSLSLTKENAFVGQHNESDQPVAEDRAGLGLLLLSSL